MPKFSHNAYPADVIQLSQGADAHEFQRRWDESMIDAVAQGVAEQRLEEQHQ